MITPKPPQKQHYLTKGSDIFWPYLAWKYKIHSKKTNGNIQMLKTLKEFQVPCNYISTYTHKPTQDQHYLTRGSDLFWPYLSWKYKI